MTQCTTLDNGLRVVTDTMDRVSSAAVGFYLATGSRHERADEVGISHFIEHLLFKGTERRSPLDIVLAFDSVGGDVNAATEREVTCYYGKVLGEDLPMAVDVLSDMLLHPGLAEEDIALERLVVEEEIGRYEDTPSELVHDHFALALWPDQALGRPILGDVQSLEGLSPERLRDYISRRYTGNRLVVSAAGNVCHERFVDLVAQHCGALPAGAAEEPEERPRAVSALLCDERDIEQVHLCLGGEAGSLRDEGRFAQAVADCALGGAASSRLFQEIREKRGLVYSVFSATSLYLDTGSLAIYAGTRPENIDQVLDLVGREVNDILRSNLRPEEIRTAKQHHRGATLIALDSISNRVSRNARSLMVFDRIVPPEEVLARIEGVTDEDVREAIQDLFANGSTCVAAIGPVSEDRIAQAARRLTSA